jgi:probable addiction module antidote protein
MKATKARTNRPHDEAVVEMLKADPAFANEYLAAALEESGLVGGQSALLAALRHISEAQGMAAVAERAGIPRESLYRALSPRGNPTIKTLLAVLNAAGLHLAVSRQDRAST